MTAKQVQKKLRKEITLTKAMGLTVTEFSESTITFFAPLKKNRNPHHTAFGGSIASLLVLSGWTLIAMAIVKSGYKGFVVAAETNTRFIKGCTEDLTVKASLSRQQINDLDALLNNSVPENRGPVRSYSISSKLVSHDNRVLAEATTSYVVLKNR